MQFARAKLDNLAIQDFEDFKINNIRYNNIRYNLAKLDNLMCTI